ncbi:hypothetical protein E1269_27105 [Jiangella asiatica]|uniref:DUF1440 domain-containing protein n=1 Tax=Jiangella asiatica TaxID=2530372 RepID=A0A4R5CI87_9ACTN|nr:hypothetical protein E1269_27105 [Jiangella asiatica]
MTPHLVHGALAGAAGTTALNATTYLDMIARGRPSSSTPHDTVKRIAELIGVSSAGDEAKREARLSGMGALLGVAVGVGTGAVLGVAQAGKWTRSPRATLSAWVLATLAGNAPMIGLRVTDPRRWRALDWAADVVPHAAYAVVVSLALERLDDRSHRKT